MERVESTADGAKVRRQYVIGGTYLKKPWIETTAGKHIQTIN